MDREPIRKKDLSGTKLASYGILGVGILAVCLQFKNPDHKVVAQDRITGAQGRAVTTTVASHDTCYNTAGDPYTLGVPTPLGNVCQKREVDPAGNVTSTWLIAETGKTLTIVKKNPGDTSNRPSSNTSEVDNEQKIGDFSSLEQVPGYHDATAQVAALPGIDFSRAASLSNPQYILIHHTASDFSTVSDGVGVASKRDPSWTQPQYHIIIGMSGQPPITGPDGRKYTQFEQLSDLENQVFHSGTANEVNNSNSIGISLIGGVTCDSNSFTDADLNTTRAITVALMRQFGIDASHVFGHKETEHVIVKCDPAGIDMDEFRRSLSSSSSESSTASTANSSCPLPENVSGFNRFEQAHYDKVLPWCNLILELAPKHNYTPAQVAAHMMKESVGDPNIISPAGAVGLLQIMPRDTSDLSSCTSGGNCYADRPTTAQLKDPRFNIDYGLTILDQKVGQYGSFRDGLMHYGPSDVGYTYADEVINWMDLIKRG